LLADEAGVASALAASFLETDRQLACDDGCTATALLLEGCADGSVLLRVANVGDSMAVLVDLSR
jgi:serine/threonine protein phosphatase PrpC